MRGLQARIDDQEGYIKVNNTMPFLIVLGFARFEGGFVRAGIA
jgi:hypothetical protein